MATIEQSVEVEVPVSTAYNQWTQFERFPEFMEHVVEVRQLDDRRLHWVAEIGGAREEWDAEITEQRPDEVIAWRALGGKANSGRVRFSGDNGSTRVTLTLDYEPEGLKEKAGAALGLDTMSVGQDLDRFKSMIESRGRESGAWRGTVGAGDPPPDMVADDSLLTGDEVALSPNDGMSEPKGGLTSQVDPSRPADGS